MAQKSNLIVGLDIGTSQVTVIIAENRPEEAQPSNQLPRVHILGVGTSASKGLRKGVVINIEATVQAIAQAVSQAEAMAGKHVQSVVASISGSHIQGFNSHGIVAIRDKEVSAYDVQKVIEAAKAVAIPMDREVLHVLAKEFIVDGQDGIKEPLGISGVRLEARVHMITGAVASAQNIVKCANRCGLNVQDIVLSSLAAGRAVVTSEEQELGVCLLDIGGGTCDLTIFLNGAVQHTAVIPIGGNHITNDIAAGLHTPLSAAEEIKCKFGSAMVSLASETETIEVPSTGGRSPRVVSRAALAEIIEPRVLEILSLVKTDLQESGYEERLTSGLVITGGGALLNGLTQGAEQLFNLPVRLGTPLNSQVSGLSDLVSSSQVATCLGLTMHGASALSHPQRFAGPGRITRVFKRAGNWLREHF